MLVNEYQLLSMRTLCDMSAALDRMDAHNASNVQLTHSIVGLSGEVGELASVLQKLVWYGKAFTADELRTKIKDEMGDVLWYVCEGLSALGISLEETMEGNIRKLKVRFPEKHTDERAADENRDRAKESQAVKKPPVLDPDWDKTVRDYAKEKLTQWEGLQHQVGHTDEGETNAKAE